MHCCSRCVLKFVIYYSSLTTHFIHCEGRMCTLPAWKTRENDDLNLSESSPLTNGDKKVRNPITS